MKFDTATVSLAQLSNAINRKTENSSVLYLPPVFPPYFLSPGTITSLLDCDLHLSILGQLHIQNATHHLLTILHCTIRCDCVLLYQLLLVAMYYDVYLIQFCQRCTIFSL